MTSTRRQFVWLAPAVALAVAGCSEEDAGESLEEVHVGVGNDTNDGLTFHFVLDGSAGLGEWQALNLAPGTDRTLYLEPKTDPEWTGYHVVAGDKQVSGSLLGQGTERRCLQLDFVVRDDDIEALMPTNQPLC